MSQESDNAYLRTVALLIIAVAAAGVVLKTLSGAFIPLVIAIVISFIAIPLIDFLQTKARLPRFLAVVATFLLVLLGLTAIGAIIASSFSDIDQFVADYRDRVTEFSQEVAHWADQSRLPVDFDEITETLHSLPVLSWTHALLGGIAGLLGKIVLILLFTLFLIASRRPNTRLTGSIGEIEQSVRTYVLTKLGTSALTGFCTWLILVMFGVEMAAFFAMMTFLLNFIPTIGSIVAVILPVPIALLQLGFGRAALVIGLLVVIQQFIGNVIDPKLMGKGLQLHPVTIMFALLVWGSIWGMIGALFAAPLTVVVRVIFDRYETTRPIANLMRGHLSKPIENV